MTTISRIVSLTILLVLSLVIVACGSATPAALPATEAPAPTSEPIAPTAAPEAESATEMPGTVDEPAPTLESPAPVAGGVSFQNDILPIFERSCVRCHGGSRREDGLDLRVYAAAMQGSENGPVIIPGDADGSKLVIQVVSGEMPRRAPKLESEKNQLIINWVNQGALDN